MANRNGSGLYQRPKTLRLQDWRRGLTTALGVAGRRKAGAFCRPTTGQDGVY